MRTAAIAIAAGIAGAILFAIPAASAKAHPRIAGLDCGALAQRVGPGNVWRTFFYGEKQTLFDQRWPFSAAPCFCSQGDCVSWLYWAQTDYPLDQEIRTCRRGLA